MKMLKRLIAIFLIFAPMFAGQDVMDVSSMNYVNDTNYYSLSSPQLIIKKGTTGEFDSVRTHTLSIVELNKNGYRFWGYYTGWDGVNFKNDMGLAFSNDLVNWVKSGNTPIIPNLRWGTAVVVDGIINMFGTRNYGGDSYIVRLTSEDGKNFKEVETVVGPEEGQLFQNPFIFYDEKYKKYRLFYFHSFDRKSCTIEEKHSEDISKLADEDSIAVLSDNTDILAAPSIMYRDGQYWLTTETMKQVNKVNTWKTIAFVSRYPTRAFVPVGNYNLLVNHDACYFPYIFDNKLNGVFSHEYDDGTWEMYNCTHEFAKKNQVNISETRSSIAQGKEKQLKVTVTYPNGNTRDITEEATWATSDNGVATVKKGEITAVKEGSAVITVSYGGASRTAAIRVLPESK